MSAGRNKKQNADFFSHDSGMRNDIKIKALRTKHGLEGYAVWCMLLEVICDSDNVEYKVDEMSYILLSGDFGIDENLLREIIDYLVKLKLISIKNDYIYSDNLKERLSPLFEKREKMRKRFLEQKQKNECQKKAEIGISVAEIGISVAEKTQSKVKESKVKENSFSQNSIEFQLSENLFNEILKNNPGHKKPNLQSWAKHVDLMIRVDKRDPDKIKDLIGWCQNDKFWKSNILSTQKLRVKFDDLVMKMNSCVSQQNGNYTYIT